MSGKAASELGRKRVRITRGQMPTPTQVLVARGSRLAKGRAQTPKAFVGPPESQECPDVLTTEDERKEWPLLCEKLQQLGVYSDTDIGAMTRYCQLWPQYTATFREVPVEREMNKRAVKPSEKIFNQWLKLNHDLLRLEVQFGLTPQSRAGAHVSPKADKPPHGNSKAGKAAKERFERRG